MVVYTGESKVEKNGNWGYVGFQYHLTCFLFADPVPLHRVRFYLLLGYGT